jgi:hypothetical protein
MGAGVDRVESSGRVVRAVAVIPEKADGENAGRYPYQRKLIAAILIVTLVLGSAWAVRWIWRDITYWSRSDTFAQGAVSLETCLTRALPGLPGVTMRATDNQFLLDIPGQEGAFVKPTPEAGIARIVVFGHSDSISKLGPPAEEPVAATLHSLKSAFSASCASP